MSKKFEYSFFDNLKNTVASETMNMDKLDEIIRGDQLKSKIELYRKTNDKSLKMDLPLVTFSGVFNKRKKSELVEHSGLICLDIDNIPYADELKDRLKEEDYIHYMFVSPSRGLKVIIKINAANEEEHLLFFKSLQKHFSSLKITIDKACKDISRGCFLSYDSTAFYNIESSTLDFDFVKKYFPIENRKIQNQETICESEDTTIESYNDVVMICVEKFLKCNNGEKHNVLLNQATHLGYYINAKLLDYTTCYNALSKAVEKRKDEIDNKDSALKTIDNGLIYGLENPKPVNGISISKTSYQFWYGYEGRIVILANMYYTFLNRNGFWGYMYNGSRILVRTQNNIVSIVKKEAIIDFTMSFIRDLEYDIGNQCTKFDLLEKFHNRLNCLVSDNQLNTFLKLKREFLLDTQDICYKYFENGVLKVTKDDKILLGYDDVEGMIWQSSIIDRQYNPSEQQLDDYIVEGDFVNFIKGVTGDKKQKTFSRYDSMKTILGYLLHNYKDPKNAKAIIFCDEQISDNPEGGVGKGLVLSALAKYKKMTVVDGKNFSFRKNFAFQQVDLDTRILAFDDVKMLFDFKSLFGVITEGIAVEKKNKDTMYIKYEDSPKVLITTNYVIEGEGNSYERRKVEIEFSQHYNKTHTPFDEFNKTLFDEWDDEQWLYFDIFMTNCIQSFLTNGIIQPVVKNIPKRKLRQGTSKEFALFVEKLDLLEKNGKEYCVKLIKSKFEVDYPHFKQFNWFTSYKFNSWLKLYGEVFKYDTEFRYSNNVHYISFTENK